MKWKKRLVKDVKLSLQLTEVMKIVRLTSSLPDVFRLSSPKPMRRHGKRLALLSRSYLTLNTLSFVLLRDLLPHLPSPNFPYCSSPRESASVFADYLRSHFYVFQPKAMRSKVRASFPSSPSHVP